MLAFSLTYLLTTLLAHRCLHEASDDDGGARNGADDPPDGGGGGGGHTPPGTPPPHAAASTLVVLDGAVPPGGAPCSPGGEGDGACPISMPLSQPLGGCGGLAGVEIDGVD